MDEIMMKAGGEIKRKELIAMFGDLSLTEDKSKMSTEEQKRATEGEDGQS
jgi:hypothetical protein